VPVWNGHADDTGYFANGDNVGYSFHGGSYPASCEINNPLADFTNGWPVGFFQKVFDHGRQCSVQFELEQCPPLAGNYSAREFEPVCPYNGVQVVEVSHSYMLEGGIDDQNIGFQSPISNFPGNNPHAETYKETASFNSGSPSKQAVASILATDIR
jgi:hypothetical protein